LKLNGKRWRYEIGNTEVLVDNAYSLWGWAQERWLINSKVVKSTGGWFSLSRAFDEPWLTALGEGVLEVKLRAAVKDVRCTVLIDGEEIEPDSVFRAVWPNQGSWPASEEWIEVDRTAHLS